MIDNHYWKLMNPFLNAALEQRTTSTAKYGDTKLNSLIHYGRLLCFEFFPSALSTETNLKCIIKLLNNCEHYIGFLNRFNIVKQLKPFLMKQMKLQNLIFENVQLCEKNIDSVFCLHKHFIFACF